MRRFIGALGWAVCLASGAACQRPRPGPVGAAAPGASPPPSSSPSSAPAASAALSFDGGREVPAVAVHLEVAPTPADAAGLSLWVRLTGRVEPVEVARFSPSQRCAASVQYAGGTQTLVVGCDPAADPREAVSLLQHEMPESLRVVDHDGVAVTLPASSVAFEPVGRPLRPGEAGEIEIHGQPQPPSCPPDAVGPVVHVFAEPVRTKADGSRWLRVRVPDLGVAGANVVFLGDADDARCAGAVLQGRELTETCVFTEAYATARVHLQGGLLFVEGTLSNDDGMYVAPRGGEVLPCGARVQFHEATFRDAKWRKSRDVCAMLCSDRQERCEERCDGASADAGSEPPGQACKDGCRAEARACPDRCPN